MLSILKCHDLKERKCKRGILVGGGLLCRRSAQMCLSRHRDFGTEVFHEASVTSHIVKVPDTRFSFKVTPEHSRFFISFR